MANWTFNANDVEEFEFSPIPEGNHRIRIYDIEEKVSQSNKQMLKITLEVSGYASKVWDYLVFDDTDEAARKRTNTKISQMASSFSVKPEAIATKYKALKGKVGGCRIKHSLYNGETQSKVSFYLSKDKVKDLPAWKNAGGSNSDIDIIDDDDDMEF